MSRIRPPLAILLLSLAAAGALHSQPSFTGGGVAVDAGWLARAQQHIAEVALPHRAQIARCATRDVEQGDTSRARGRFELKGDLLSIRREDQPAFQDAVGKRRQRNLPVRAQVFQVQP